MMIFWRWKPMLAQTPTAERDITYFVRALRLPAVPEAIREAEEVLRVATSARKEAQARHAEASLQFKAQKPGEAPTITHQQLDEIGSQIAGAAESEEAARQKFESLVREYRDQVSSLAAPLDELSEALIHQLSIVHDLLKVAAVLQADARTAKVKLPGSLPIVATTVMGQLDTVRTLLERTK
jgi:ribosomal protein L16 Arg81 hydroxylase